MVCSIYDIYSYANDILADKVVKVPEMAESITEGTLKQWSKREQMLCGFYKTSEAWSC